MRIRSGPHSPFSIQADDSWGKHEPALSEAAQHGQPQKTIQRKKGFLNSSTGKTTTAFPTAPSGGGFVGSEYPKAVPAQSGSSSRLRRAASAESLRSRAQSGSATTGLAVPEVSRHEKDPPSEIKNLWKSLSNRVNGKTKDRERFDSGIGHHAQATRGTAHIAGRTAAVEASRRSLSTYPCHSAENRASISSASFGSLHEVTAESSHIPMSSGVVKSRVGPDVHGPAHSTSAMTQSMARRSPTGGHSAYPQHSAIPTGHRRSGLGLEHQLDEDIDDEWVHHQTFTHDLSQRRHTGPFSGRSAVKKASIAHLDHYNGHKGLTTEAPTESREEEEIEIDDEEESDGETEEVSGVASQLSYVDSADLTIDSAECSHLEGVAGRPERAGTLLNRNVGMLLAEPEPGLSILQRNRKKSRTHYSGSIKTAPASHVQSPQISPQASAPVKRLPSEGGGEPLTIQLTSKKQAREAVDSGTGMLTPTTPIRVLSPNTSIHTTRPRSLSECASHRAAHEVASLAAGSSDMQSRRLTAVEGILIARSGDAANDDRSLVVASATSSSSFTAEEEARAAKVRQFRAFLNLAEKFSSLRS